MKHELCNTVMLPMTWVTSRRISQVSQFNTGYTRLHYTHKKPTDLGLVKLQHRHRSSELIKLLHDHGFIVSYDEVFRFKKSATKFVGDSDRSSILHQAMTGVAFCLKPWV